jgi:hypothetical protein
VEDEEKTNAQVLVASEGLHMHQQPEQKEVQEPGEGVIALGLHGVEIFV